MLREIKKNKEHYFEDSRCRKQGEYKSWWPNGLKKEQGFYVDGKRQGEFTRWYRTGQLSYSGIYVDNMPYGEYKSLWRDGTIFKHCFYVNDKEVSFMEIPYPETGEDRMYFKLKHDIPLLPVENVC